MSEARMIECVKCGCIGDAEEMVYVASEDAYFCSDCAEEAGFVKCELCGGWHHVDDMTEVISLGGEVVMWCDECVNMKAFECDHCGQFYDERYFHTYNVESDGYDEEWCEHCLEDDAEVCGECGCYVNKDYATWVDCENAYVCDSCRDWYFERCDTCDEWFRSESLYHSSRGGNICYDCAADSWYWYWCDECETFVYEDEWDEEFGCCSDCIGTRRRSGNARIRSHSGDEPPMKFFGRYSGVFAGGGVELEIDSDSVSGSTKQNLLNKLDELFEDSNGDKHAYFKYDGSLHNGIEIVTQPHTIEAFYELPWAEVLQACIDHGFSSHEIGTCGLHMHLSREMFGENDETQADNIAKMMQFYNIYWDDIVKVSRRTHDQVSQWANKYPTARRSSLKCWADKKNKYYDRYMAVNVMNDATVEIRINRGTLKLSTFLATVDFIVTTAKNSAKIRWEDVTDDFKWLNGLKKETLEYIQSRRAFSEPVGHYLSEYWREEQARMREEHERQLQELVAQAEMEPLDMDDDLEPFGEHASMGALDELLALLQTEITDEMPMEASF